MGLRAAVRCLLTIADRIVGLFAVNAILAALRHRDVTGRGQRIDVPMFETMANLPFIDQRSSRRPFIVRSTARPRRLARLLAPEPPAVPHQGRLSRRTVIYNDKQHWWPFRRAIGRVADIRGRSALPRSRQPHPAHSRNLWGKAADIFVTRTTAEWMRSPRRGRHSPYAASRPSAILAADPHLGRHRFLHAGRASDRRQDPRPDADVRAHGAIAKQKARSPAPTLGEHSR